MRPRLCQRGKLTVGILVQVSFEVVGIRAALDRFPETQLDRRRIHHRDVRRIRIGCIRRRVRYCHNQLVRAIAFDHRERSLLFGRAEIDRDSLGHRVLNILHQLRERDLAFVVRCTAFQSFDDGPTEIALLLFCVFVSALADARGIDRGERLHFAIAHIEIESVGVGVSQRINRVGSSAGIVAAGVEQNYDLSHSGFFDALLNAIHADRRLFEERNLIADLRVRRKQESLPASFHSVPGERDEQQTILWYGGAEIRQAPQNIDARRLALSWLIGREQNHLIPREARIAHQRIRDQARVVVRTFERTDLRILVLVDANHQRPALSAYRQTRYLIRLRRDVSGWARRGWLRLSRSRRQLLQLSRRGLSRRVRCLLLRSFLCASRLWLGLNRIHYACDRFLG